MSAVQRALVVGAGPSGATTALELARAGIEVELVGDNSEGQHGSSMWIPGNGLRVLEKLGLLDVAVACGVPFDTIGLRSVDGSLIAERDDLRSGGPDLPANLGIASHQLCELLVAAAVQAGVRHRAAGDWVRIDPAEHKVSAEFTDGTSATYDLLIGADGPHSPIRSLLGLPEHQPNGMQIWTATSARPPGLNAAELTFDGPDILAGIFPTGPETACVYLLTGPSTVPQTDTSRLARFSQLAARYLGPWRDAAAGVHGQIAVIAVRTGVLAPPWHHRRMIIVGDAVHSLPPNLPQGVALAMEDAAALAEVLTQQNDLAVALSRYEQQRESRISTIGGAADQLASWLVTGVRGDVPRVMGQVAHELVGSA